LRNRTHSWSVPLTCSLWTTFGRKYVPRGRKRGGSSDGFASVQFCRSGDEYAEKLLSPNSKRGYTPHPQGACAVKQSGYAVPVW